jgi:xanthine dehydrogenase YagR molybdenum-binding subunit
MTAELTPRAIGRPLDRLEGPLKVTGHAAYAYEVPVAEPLYAHLVQSTIAKGTVTRIDTSAARSLDGVVTVLDHTNAPRLSSADNRELAALQDNEIGFRGQVVAVVVAESPEAAREGARLVQVDYDEHEHHVILREGDPREYKPEKVNPDFATDTSKGDLEQAVTEAAVVVDEVYRTPYEYNNPMEPHAVTALWEDDGSDDATSGSTPRLTLHASTQSVHGVVSTLAPILGLERDQLHVSSPYVGGGFGSKGLPHVHDVVASMAAQTLPGRAVRLALTRQQMFSLAGYRTATIQHFQLAADSDGRLLGINHEVLEQTSAIKEFAEQTAIATRHMYAAPNRHTSHRLVPLDVPVPSWMRAPGEMPGMAAHEIAMDELAVACGIDPVELRVLNEPERDPETDLPFGHRRLVDCLREGASRFGWDERDPRPGSRRDGDWLVGLGVASATYPYYQQPANKARVRAMGQGRYAVSIGAADIGTGALTVLTQIAADALGVEVGSVEVAIGDSSLPPATVAGGSAGTASWGAAITAAARAFRDEHGDDPPQGVETTTAPPPNENLEKYSLHSFGAQFVELGVNVWTGELRVRRALGVFSAGRIINPVTARSQFLGGMTMGLSTGLFEEAVRDPRFGNVVTQDLASYHVAAHADVPEIEAVWLDEQDPLTNPMGSRGIGEIGIVGMAAAVVNAAYHATGVRLREIPVTADRFLDLDPTLPALHGHPVTAYA